MGNIKVGDICHVINSGLVYPSYREFAIEAGHPDMITEEYVEYSNSKTVGGKIVKVLYIGVHCMYSNLPLAVVEIVDKPSGLKFIIEVEGLSIDMDRTIHQFVDEYLSGKPIGEKIADERVSKFLIQAIILNNPMDIQFVSEKLITDEDYARVLKKDGGLLGIIPEARRTLELCNLAIKNEEYAERFIPERFKSLVE